MALGSIALAAGIFGGVFALTRLLFRQGFAHRAFGGDACGGGGYGRGFDGESRRGFGPWGRFGRRGGGIGRSFWLRSLYARLDTTPGQEREIRAAIEELRERARDAKSGFPETRENIGRSIAAETFDESAFEAASARVDATAEKLKDAFGSALKRIHAVLDAKQRERLADIVGKGFGPWSRRGFGGPYRGGAAS